MIKVHMSKQAQQLVSVDAVLIWLIGNDRSHPEPEIGNVRRSIRTLLVDAFR